MMTSIKKITAARLRTMVRQYCNVTATSVPVYILTGNDSAPAIEGERGGYFTKSGERIAHPSAYGRKGWNNMVYRRSTLMIVVGDEWISLNMGVDVYDLGDLADEE